MKNNMRKQAARVPSITDGGSCELADHVAVDVTDSIDSPSENSGAQLVYNVTINVPSSIEVSNNSGLQFVPDVAITVTSDPEVPNNNSSGQQDSNNDSDGKLAGFVAVTNFVTGITAIMFKTPSSSEPIYLVAVGMVLTAGVLEALAALWVSRDPRKRRTFERIVRFVSIATFIIGILLNIYAFKVKK